MDNCAADGYVRLQCDLAVALSTETEAEAGYRHALDTAMALAEIDACGFYRATPAGDQLVLVAYRGVSAAFVAAAGWYGEDAAQMRMVDGGRPFYAGYDATSFIADATDVRRREGLRAIGVVPVRYRGEVLGTLNVASRHVEHLDPETRSTVETLAIILGGFVARLDAAEAEQAAHERFRTFFNTMADLAFVLGEDGTVLLANQAVSETLGYGPDELLGCSVLDLHRVEDHATAAAIVEAMLAGEAEFCPLPLVTKHGELVSVETRVTPGQWRGRPVLFGMSRDISSRMAVERALVESERRFETIFEGSPLGIYKTSVNGRILVANPALAEMLGYPDAATLKAERDLDAASSYGVDDERRAFKSLLEATGELRSHESTWRRRDGTLIHVRESARLVCDEETGELCGYEGTVEDITVQKQAAAALRYRADFENLVATTSAHFVSLSPQDLDKGIQETLAAIGDFTGADRSYVFLFDPDAATMNNTHEWCAPGIQPEQELLQGLPNETFPWWVAQIQCNQSIVVPDVGMMPSEAAAERALLEAQDIQSVIVVPLWQGESAIGYLGLDAVQAAEAWSEDCLALLRLIGDVFANSLVRRQMEDALRESEERLQLAVAGADLGVWDWDLRTDAVSFSPRWVEMLGYDVHAFSPELGAWEALIHPNDRHRVMEVLDAHLAGERPFYETEHRLRAKDGTWRWVLGRGQVVARDAEGAPLRVAGTHLDITDRKHAEMELARYRERLEDLVRQRTEALRTSEERYRAIVEQAQEGLVLLDCYGRVVEWNQRLEAITGLSRSAVLDCPLWDSQQLITAVEIFDDAASLQASLEGLFALPVDAWPREGVQTQITRKDGPGESSIVLFIRVFPVRLADSLLLGALVSDVTSEVQAHQAAQEAERLYRALFERANDAVFILDLEGVHVAVNHRAYEMLGYEVGELVGMALDDLVVAEELDQAYDRLAALLDAGSLPIYERHFRAKDGSLVPVELNVSVVEDNAGRPYQIQSIARDLRSRKEAEAQLHLQAAALSAAADGIVITDNKGVIEWVNPAFTSLTGYLTEEVVGRRISLLKSGQHDRGYYTHLWETIRSGRVWRNEIVNRRKDGVLYTESNTITPLRDEEGGISRFIAIKRDISERKVLERQLREDREQLAARVDERTADLQRTNAELARAVRAKDEFLASMSHELRTPLAAILGYSEVLKLQHRGTLNPNQIRFVDSIDQSGRHLLELINEILDLSKIEAGALKLTPATVRVQEIADSSLMFVKQLAADKHIQLHLDIDAEVDAMHVDRVRLKQILVNLLNNAVKFTSEGGEVGLEIHGDERQSRLTFTVWDTGIGIEASDMGRLFKPFEQIDSRLSRRYAGTGLGLVMVARLAELLGGSVGVESTPGEGSRFSVALPWSPLPSGRPPRASAGDAPEVGFDPRTVAGGTILLVEDNATNVEMVKGFLTDAGYHIIVAYNGRQALHTAHKSRPQLILMDVQIPEIDGLEVTRLLRENRDFDGVPIIVLTALAMPGDRERSLKAGADAYMSKPVRLVRLLEVVQAHLR